MDRISQSLQLKSNQLQKPCRSDLPSTLSREFTSKYEINCPLGWGGFGFVTMITSKINDSNAKLACKFIPRGKIPSHYQIGNSDIPLEVILLKSFNHENIISFHDFYKDNKYYYIITECHGLMKDRRKSKTKRVSMDLFEYIEVHEFLSESTSKSIFKQIISAISYIHSLGIVHGDIKDENILIDESDKVKLIDFGSASFYNGKKFNRFLGTIQYASPEILRGESYDAPSAEVWALGCCLYTMLTGQIPFKSQRHVIFASFYPPIRQLSHECIHLISCMLEKDANKRFTIDQIINHDWLRS